MDVVHDRRVALGGGAADHEDVHERPEEEPAEGEHLAAADAVVTDVVASDPDDAEQDGEGLRDGGVATPSRVLDVELDPPGSLAEARQDLRCQRNRPSFVSDPKLLGASNRTSPMSLWVGQLPVRGLCLSARYVPLSRTLPGSSFLLLTRCSVRHEDLVYSDG